MSNDRTPLINFYGDNSTMTYGGSIYYGLEDIKDKIESFKFNSIQYAINDKDVQLGPIQNSFIVTVIGQLIMDNSQEQTFTFFHVFNVCPNGSGGFYIHNDIFRTMG